MRSLKKNGPPVWLSTIYRILDVFAEKALVIKSSVLDSGMAVYELSGYRHTHYAVCMGCHRIVPMEKLPDGQVRTQARGPRFPYSWA